MSGFVVLCPALFAPVAIRSLGHFLGQLSARDVLAIVISQLLQGLDGTALTAGNGGADPTV